VIDILQLFEALVQPATVAAPDPSSTNYGHHLKVSMLLNMVKDLLRPELLKLSDKELEGRIMKISSLSEHQWQEVHGKGVTSGTIPDDHQSNSIVENGYSMNGSSRGPHANGFSKVNQVNGSWYVFKIKHQRRYTNDEQALSISVEIWLLSSSRALRV
jgi:hypothetical protein